MEAGPYYPVLSEFMLPEGCSGVPARGAVESPAGLVHCGTFPGVTTCANAFMIVGAGLFLPAGMSEFTNTTITAFFSGK
jgi:hypothetical protein